MFILFVGSLEISMLELVQQYFIISTSSIVTICLSLVLLTLWFWRRLFEKYKYPPGPIPLPIIGNDYFLFNDLKALYKYSKSLRFCIITFMLLNCEGKIIINGKYYRSWKKCLLIYITLFTLFIYR